MKLVIYALPTSPLVNAFDYLLMEDEEFKKLHSTDQTQQVLPEVEVKPKKVLVDVIDISQKTMDLFPPAAIPHMLEIMSIVAGKMHLIGRGESESEKPKAS